MTDYCCKDFQTAVEDDPEFCIKYFPKGEDKDSWGNVFQVFPDAGYYIFEREYHQYLVRKISFCPYCGTKL